MNPHGAAEKILSRSFGLIAPKKLSSILLHWKRGIHAGSTGVNWWLKRICWTGLKRWVTTTNYEHNIYGLANSIQRCHAILINRISVFSSEWERTRLAFIPASLNLHLFQVRVQYKFFKHISNMKQMVWLRSMWQNRLAVAFNMVIKVKGFLVSSQVRWSKVQKSCG